MTRRKAVTVMCAGGFLLATGVTGCSSNADDEKSNTSTPSANVITPSSAFTSQERVLWYEAIWGVGKDSEFCRLHIVENGEVTTYRATNTLGQVANMTDEEIIQSVQNWDAKQDESCKTGPRVVQAVLRTDQTGNAVSGEGLVSAESMSSVGKSDWIYKATIIGEEWLDGVEGESTVYSSTYAGFRAPAGDTHLSLIRRVEPGMAFALDGINAPGTVIVD